MQHLFNHFSININISLCFCLTFAYCLMAYMSARTSLFLGRENLDAIIAIVCLEMPCILADSITESLRCFLVMFKVFTDNNFRGVYFYYYYHEYYCCYYHYHHYYYIIITIIISSFL